MNIMPGEKFGTYFVRSFHFVNKKGIFLQIKDLSFDCLDKVLGRHEECFQIGPDPVYFDRASMLNILNDAIVNEIYEEIGKRLNTSAGGKGIHMSLCMSKYLPLNVRKNLIQNLIETRKTETLVKEVSKYYSTNFFGADGVCAKDNILVKDFYDALIQIADSGLHDDFFDLFKTSYLEDLHRLTNRAWYIGIGYPTKLYKKMRPALVRKTSEVFVLTGCIEEKSDFDSVIKRLSKRKRVVMLESEVLFSKFVTDSTIEESGIDIHEWFKILNRHRTEFLKSDREILSKEKLIELQKLLFLEVLAGSLSTTISKAATETLDVVIKHYETRRAT